MSETGKQVKTIDDVCSRLELLEQKIDTLVKMMQSREEILNKGKETISNIHSIFGGDVHTGIYKMLGITGKETSEEFTELDDECCTPLPALEERKVNPFE